MRGVEVIGRPGCPECDGRGGTLDAFGDPDMCPLCLRARAEGLIGRWMTVDASRLYARLVHPAGRGRRS